MYGYSQRISYKKRAKGLGMNKNFLFPLSFKIKKIDKFSSNIKNYNIKWNSKTSSKHFK